MSQKFHGIVLANNSVAENFHFERLAVDPTVVNPGRIWFNIPQKLFKYTSLDAGGLVVVHSFGDLSGISSDIIALQAGLIAEENARIAAIADEAEARVAADAVVASNASNLIGTETSARLAGDAAQVATSTAIQTELDTTQASVGLNVDGTYSAPLSTTYLGTSTSIKGASVLLDTAISDEVLARTNKDTTQDAALAAETQSRIDADTNLQTQLTVYINAAVTNNTNADNAETLRATTAESAIKTELDLTQATIGTAANGSLVPYVGTSYLDSATTLVAATIALDTQVNNVNQAVAAEALARAAANVSFNTSLTDEITNRTNSDTAIQTEINNVEAGAGLEANGLYVAPTGSNYLNAAISLKDADFILDSAVKSVSNIANAAQTQITNEVTRATNAEGALLTAINNLVLASGDGSVALKATLNGGRFTFKSTVAALTHVIQHNLNTEFYTLDIKVEGDDLVYRNDICPVEEIDLNSFRISLSEVRNVKVGVLSLAPIV